MERKFYKELQQLVASMLIAVEDADDRDLAVEAKEEYEKLITQAVWDEFLGNNAELVVIDPMILEKKQ